MGNNASFNVLAEQTVSLYNKQLLTKEILVCLLEPFRGTDIDTGDSDFYIAEDGKESLEIICSVMEPEEYFQLEKKYNFPFSSNKGKTKDNNENLDNFQSEVYDLWREKIVTKFNFW